MEILDVAFALTCQIVVDDVSGGQGAEYRCSVYDSDGDLISESWGVTVSESIGNAFIELEEK
jgi:hypothetical protein